MTDPATTYLLANGGVLILILGQLFRMERRLGRGDGTFDRVHKHCPLFNGNKLPDVCPTSKASPET